MQFKMFSADNPDGIVKSVNAWLSGERGIKILHTETRPVVTDMEKGFSGLLFSVWYDQE